MTKEFCFIYYVVCVKMKKEPMVNNDISQKMTDGLEKCKTNSFMSKYSFCLSPYVFEGKRFGYITQWPMNVAEYFRML